LSESRPHLTSPGFSQVRLSDFDHLWLRLLDLMEKFMWCSELLAEAVPESLKNCVLVMSTSGVLPAAQAAHLWKLTRSRLESFLPGKRCFSYRILQ
jgi:brefeldin A-resistance guanine nucleotide exchange factor 1